MSVMKTQCNGLPCHGILVGLSWFTCCLHVYSQHGQKCHFYVFFPSSILEDISRKLYFHMSKKDSLHNTLFLFIYSYKQSCNFHRSVANRHRFLFTAAIKSYSLSSLCFYTLEGNKGKKAVDLMKWVDDDPHYSVHKSSLLFIRLCISIGVAGEFHIF